MEISKGIQFQSLISSLSMEHEMSPLELRNILNRTIEKWNETFNDAIPRLNEIRIKGRTKETDIPKRVFLDFSLNISSRYLMIDVHSLKDGVLRSIFPPYFFTYYLLVNSIKNIDLQNPRKSLTDFAFGLTWLCLKGLRSRIKEVWYDVLPPWQSDVYPGIIYDFFTYVEQLSRATDLNWTLDKYVSRILNLRGQKLSHWEMDNIPYLGLIPYTSLGRNFLQVVKLRIKYQDYSLKKLAEMLGLSKKTLQKRLNLLMKSYLLQERNYANFEPLGLFVLNIIVSSAIETEIKSCKESLKSLPNIYRLSEFRGWHTVIQSKFLLPKNSKTTDQIIAWLNRQNWFNTRKSSSEVIVGTEIPEDRFQYLSAEGLEIESGIWHLRNPSKMDGFTPIPGKYLKFGHKKKQIVMDLFNKKPDAKIREKHGISQASLSNLKRTLREAKVLKKNWVFAPQGLLPYLILFDGKHQKYTKFLVDVASRVPVALVNRIGTIPRQEAAADAKALLMNPKSSSRYIGIANLFIPNGYQRETINQVKKIDGNAKIITDPLIVPYSPTTEKLIPTQKGWKAIKLA